MEAFNTTYLTLDGHVELSRFRYLYFTLLFTVYVVIVSSNCTVVYLIWKHPDLHEPMYVFIAALLLNSVLLSTNIYPKLLVDFLSDRQVVSHQACLLQFTLFYGLVASEFLLLAAMAYDRYVSICRPLHYRSVMTKRTVCVTLAFAWLVPLCQLASLAVMCSSQRLCSLSLKSIFCNNMFYKLFCVASREISAYGALILVDAEFLPAAFVIFTYSRILLICYHSSADVRRKAAHTCLPHLLVLSNYLFSITYDIITVRVESEFPKTVRLIMTLQLVLYNPLFNPLIYGLKMKEIHKHLKTLLCGQNLNRCS